MNKKAQAQIITTVLIILLVLAAIVIVWQVISTTIESGSENIEGTSQCIAISLEIDEAVAAGVTVKRGAGGSGDIGVKVILDGASQTAEGSGLGALETTAQIAFDSAASTGSHTVEVAGIVTDSNGNEVICDVGASKTFTV
jgi:hypothetical protein